MTEKTKQDGIDWLKSVVHKHVGANIRRYKYKVMVNAPATAAFLGFQMDISPVDGVVVEQSDDWLLVKSGRNDFFVGLKNMLSYIPENGSKVFIKPYARRRFDGKEIGAPEENISDGIRSQVFTLGDSSSRIPLDQKTLKSSYLKDMLNQLNVLPTGDGFRNIGNALVDAGGDHPALLGYQDPDDKDCLDPRPSLEFSVNTEKFQGSLVIEYNRGIDYYDIVLKKDGVEQERREDIDFTSVGPAIVDMVDDGKWRIAKVEILKAAKKKAA